jgi:AcrR family transcriptional regulator
VARDATETRNKLIRAGEQRFARDGVDGATLRDIVRTAGQANDAAVGYHFGSRDGLIRAIVERHMEAMESERSQTLGSLGDADLVEVVEMVVLPIAELLSSPEGRDFLRIAAQLAEFSGVRAAQPSTDIEDTALAAQLGRLEDLIAEDIGRQRARERVASLVTFLTASLAERARAIERSPGPGTDRRHYVEELVAMLAAAMAA